MGLARASPKKELLKTKAGFTKMFVNKFCFVLFFLLNFRKMLVVGILSITTK